VEAVRAQHLHLSGFRNYSLLDLELAPGLNLFIGANAQGKSNLLEGIHLVSSTRSFRDAKDREMVQVGQESALVRVTPDGGRPDLEIRLGIVGRRSARLGGSQLPKVSDLVGRLPSVCFGSGDLEIVSGQPARRRRLLDLELSQLFPKYLDAYATYKRSLEQRNSLLKAVREGSASQSALDPWDQKLTPAGATIRQMRIEYVEALSGFASERHSELCGGTEELSLRYASEDDAFTADALIAEIGRRRPKDIAAGTTTAGPHRDEVVIEIDGMGATSHGSQGQRRTAVLAIKIAQVDYWRDRRGTMPIVLLDDILSDLDAARREQVFALAAAFGQAIITATDFDALNPEITSGAEVHRIEAGRVVD
jgi:DNA replication and repair protein RecF